VALSGAERNRRYRARLAGKPVPRGKPGRKAKDSYFRAESPEQIVASLLNLDAQRLRDFEASVRSRGMTLSQYVEQKRQDLLYGQPRSADAPAPHDPIVEELLAFRHRSATSDETAVTRGGPNESLRTSGVDSPDAPAPCVYCSKPATYRCADGRPAHTTCERRAIRRAEAAE
jgi:hypothetical protein